MVPQILDNISDDAFMYIVNALVFEAEWSDPYEDYQIKYFEPFTDCNGNIQRVTMLDSTEYCYIHDQDATGFVKKYEGGEFAFMAILPNDENGLCEYVNNMTGKSILDLYENRSYESVIVKMPEFSYEYDNELSESLKTLGMERAFNNSADFSAMVNPADNASIGRVLHKTRIQLDRVGTKVAAATVIESTVGALFEPEPPKTIILDRPFVYAIIDTETGLPIFLGVVNSIK